MEIPNVSGSLLPLFTLWFLFSYISGYFIVFRNWSNKFRPGASSSLMSLAHGTPALLLSLLSISETQKTIAHLEFNSPNTPFQNLVLDYSTAYFLVDLLHYTVFVPNDVLFILHHVATLYVLVTCRYAFGHGAVAILGILVIAEATTTCQNTWSLARFRKGDSARAAALFDFLSPIFYAYYTGVRGIVAPLFVYRIVGGVLDSGVGGNGVIPRWAWISWIVVTVVGIGLSVWWVLCLWINLYRQKSERELKKLS